MVVLTAAALSITIIFPRLLPPVHRSVVWAGVLLTSFAGWGRVVTWLAFPRRQGDLGLRLAWGMAAVAALGGFACSISWATQPFALGLVLAGLGAEVVAIARSEHPVALPGLSLSLMLAAVSIPVLIQFYGGAAGAWISTADDLPLYLAFPKKILDTGTLIEPFSMRRMAAYGGQSFFQALTLLGSASALQVPVFELGICLVVVLALVIGGGHSRTRWGWLLPAVLLLTLPPVYINTASELSGCVFFLALYRTAAWHGFDAHSWRAGLVLGLLAAAAASLRNSYIPPAALFLLIVSAPTLVRVVRSSDGERWRRLAAAASAPLALLVLLLPWMLLSYRSNATVLYPLFNGDYRPEYGALTAANPVIGQASWFWMNLRTDWPVRSIALFFLAVPLVPWNRTRGALPALALASVCGFAAIVQAFPLSTTFHVARYYFAFVFATALAVTMAVWGARLPPHRYRVRLLSARALVLGALAWQAWSIGATSSAVPYRVYLSLAANAVGSPSSLRDRGDAYRALQAAIPAGAPVLAMLDEPFWLDFRRNPIALADLPGHASPSPGLPVDDTDALVHYLAMQGVRYLAFVRPSKSIDLYQPRKWVAAGYVSMLPQSERLASGYIWRNAAPRYLKFFDRLDDLMISRPRLYDDGTFVVLDLQDSWW